MYSDLLCALVSGTRDNSQIQESACQRLHAVTGGPDIVGGFGFPNPRAPLLYHEDSTLRERYFCTPNAIASTNPTFRMIMRKAAQADWGCVIE